MSNIPTETSAGTIYEVFARFREDGMHHLGTVVATSDELAKMYAVKLYDEWGWQEMAIVPRREIVTVVGVR